jgi:ribosomal protein S12 methylthiotransferase
MSVFLSTLGCPKNQADSGHILGKITGKGISVSETPEDADVILINTCGFIEDAKRESIEEILRLSKLKTNGRHLIVFGCLAQRYKEELLGEIPEIDAIFGVGEEEKIADMIVSLRKENEEGGGFTQKAESPYAYLKIAEGCDGRCTFCVIPSIRGPFRSIPPEDILSEAEEKLSFGVRELILIAQDITEYGKGLKRGYDLKSLLKDLSAIKGDFRIRLLYLYPSGVDEGLLEVVASLEKIHKYLDIPLQHSEDRMLRLMGRRGSKKEYERLLRRIRRMMPGAALRTTFMVGFPGETEEDFRGLMDFVEEARFDRLGVFKYSKEEGAASYKMKGHIPASLKERRFDELMRLQSGISFEKNKELIGRELSALIDASDGGSAIGRIYSQSPEIDGVVFIEGEGIKAGDYVDVEITDAMDYDLKGVLLHDRVSVK